MLSVHCVKHEPCLVHIQVICLPAHPSENTSQLAGVDASPSNMLQTVPVDRAEFRMPTGGKEPYNGFYQE
jgi:hypothetical protein